MRLSANSPARFSSASVQFSRFIFKRIFDEALVQRSFVTVAFCNPGTIEMLEKWNDDAA